MFQKRFGFLRMDGSLHHGAAWELLNKVRVEFVALVTRMLSWVFSQFFFTWIKDTAAASFRGSLIQSRLLMGFWAVVFQLASILLEEHRMTRVKNRHEDEEEEEEDDAALDEGK